MTDDGNAVRNGVRTPFVTLPHTTPHHTTKNTPSRGMALEASPEDRDEDALDLARVVCSLRPDWTWAATKAAIRRDDRPWATVVAGSIRGALLTGADHIRHPNGLRYVNADGHGATPVPPKYDRRIPCNCPDCAKGTP